VTLVSIAGSVANTFIGKDAANVHAPCIIFMDEADEAAKQRGKNVGMGGATTDAGTTALLAEIDGIESKSGIHNGVHWMAATNYVEKIDEAIKRSGRLKILNFTLSGINALKKLLQLFFGKLTKLPLLPDFQPASDAVASMLVGKTGADIQELANSFAEMGPSLVDDIDQQVRVYQKLGQFLAWHIATILMRSDVVWEMFDEVLNSPDRIILQDRFYQYWERIIADRKIKAQLLALPGIYRQMAERTILVTVPNPNQAGPGTITVEEPAVLSWTPSRQSFWARRAIQRKIAWLQSRYEQAQLKLIKSEVEASDIDELIAAALVLAPPAVPAASGEDKSS